MAHQKPREFNIRRLADAVKEKVTGPLRAGTDMLKRSTQTLKRIKPLPGRGKPEERRSVLERIEEKGPEDAQGLEEIATMLKAGAAKMRRKRADVVAFNAGPTISADDVLAGNFDDFCPKCQKEGLEFPYYTVRNGCPRHPDLDLLEVILNPELLDEEEEDEI